MFARISRRAVRAPAISSPAFGMSRNSRPTQKIDTIINATATKTDEKPSALPPRPAPAAARPRTATTTGLAKMTDTTKNTQRRECRHSERSTSPEKVGAANRVAT